MLERRRYHRPRVCLRAFMTEGPHSPIEPVQLRNLSEHGAELVLPKGHIPSEAIELRIPRKGQTRRAKIVWRHFERFGVEFFGWAEDQAQEVEAANLSEWDEALNRRFRDIESCPAASRANPRADY